MFANLSLAIYLQTSYQMVNDVASISRANLIAGPGSHLPEYWARQPKTWLLGLRYRRRSDAVAYAQQVSGDFSAAIPVTRSDDGRYDVSVEARWRSRAFASRA